MKVTVTKCNWQHLPSAYNHRLPHTEVEAVVPAYCSFADAETNGQLDISRRF